MSYICTTHFPIVRLIFAALLMNISLSVDIPAAIKHGERPFTEHMQSVLRYRLPFGELGCMYQIVVCKVANIYDQASLKYLCLK